MKRMLIAATWALTGLFLSLALTFGAYTLASRPSLQSATARNDRDVRVDRERRADPSSKPPSRSPDRSETVGVVAPTEASFAALSRLVTSSGGALSSRGGERSGEDSSGPGGEDEGERDDSSGPGGGSECGEDWDGDSSGSGSCGDDEHD